MTDSLQQPENRTTSKVGIASQTSLYKPGKARVTKDNLLQNSLGTTSAYVEKVEAKEIPEIELYKLSIPDFWFFIFGLFILYLSNL